LGLPISIVIADDHQMVRQGLRALLIPDPTMSVVGEARSGMEALTLTRQLEPDVLVLDLAMSGLSGMEVMRRLQAAGSRTRIVVLTMHASDAYV